MEETEANGLIVTGFLSAIALLGEECTTTDFSE